MKKMDYIIAVGLSEQIIRNSLTLPFSRLTQDGRNASLFVLKNTP